MEIEFAFLVAYFFNHILHSYTHTYTINTLITQSIITYWLLLFYTFRFFFISTMVAIFNSLPFSQQYTRILEQINGNAYRDDRKYPIQPLVSYSKCVWWFCMPISCSAPHTHTQLLIICFFYSCVHVMHSHKEYWWSCDTGGVSVDDVEVTCYEEPLRWNVYCRYTEHEVLKGFRFTHVLLNSLVHAYHSQYRGCVRWECSSAAYPILLYISYVLWCSCALRGWDRSANMMWNCTCIISDWGMRRQYLYIKV